MTKQTHEPGYRAVLVREETKEQLKALRKEMPERDLCQERRLATAALEIVLESGSKSQSTRDQLLVNVREVVSRDIAAV